MNPHFVLLWVFVAAGRSVCGTESFLEDYGGAGADPSWQSVGGWANLRKVARRSPVDLPVPEWERAEGPQLASGFAPPVSGLQCVFMRIKEHVTLCSREALWLRGRRSIRRLTHTTLVSRIHSLLVWLCTSDAFVDRFLYRFFFCLFFLIANKHRSVLKPLVQNSSHSLHYHHASLPTS